jgi:predicted phage terminase large subunit-like protein
MCRFWDMASTEQKGNNDPDFTAGALMGYYEGMYYICDLRHDRLTPKGNENLVRQTAIIDGENVFIRMEEEGGSSGKAMIDHYRRTVLQGFNFAGIRSTGSKELRATPLSGQAESGNVAIVRGDWNKVLLDELVSFSPDAVHDDAVDGCAGAFLVLSGKVRQGVISKQDVDTDTIKRDKLISEILNGMTPEERLEADKLMKQYEQ